MLKTMIKQRKHFLILLLCILSALLLTACQKKGRLDEGDCKCNISFADIPKEFTMLEQNLQEQFEITVVLENTVSETQYDILLNQKNDYSVQVSLHPGIYQVKYLSNNMSLYNGITLAADADSVELTADTVSELAIRVDNPEEFSQNWMATQPMPEILLADKFSRQLQINRKVINLSDILSVLNLTTESDASVAPYRKTELTDSAYGITVTVLNNSDKNASWQECDVIAIHVTRNTVVFPEGVTLGMAGKQVLDKTSGLYGEPDACTGSLLFGWALDDTGFIYNDSVSGDKLTVTLDADGNYITDITYEFACFE